MLILMFMGTDGSFIGIGPGPKLTGIPVYACTIRCSARNENPSLPLSHFGMIKNSLNNWTQLWKTHIVFEVADGVSGGCNCDEATLPSILDSLLVDESRGWIC